MNAVSGYLMKVICAAIVCALVGAIAGDGPGQRVRKLIAGVFLALTVLSPMGETELPRIDTDRLNADAQAAVRDGTDQAELARNDIISEACEAYILNKADELGLQMQVRVTLDEEGLPASAELTGKASPLERETLSSCIARDLGLGKEAQIWNDPYQSSE